jgi:hypothetical protein
MSLLHSPKIVTNGLVLCLDAASRKSYPGTGNVWRDLSGNGNDGTLTNGPTFSSANGGSIVFDGINDYINCGQSLITGNNSFSWGSFINPAAGNGTPLFFGNTSGGEAMLSFYNNNKVRVGVFGSDKLVSNTEIPISSWGYTFWTWDGNTLRSYTNGLQDGTATGFSFNISNLYINIGGVFGINQYFNGKISLVQIYNRALTPQEVQQNFNATRGRYGI